VVGLLTALAAAFLGLGEHAVLRGLNATSEAPVAGSCAQSVSLIFFSRHVIGAALFPSPPLQAPKSRASMGAAETETASQELVSAFQVSLEMRAIEVSLGFPLFLSSSTLGALSPSLVFVQSAAQARYLQTALGTATATRSTAAASALSGLPARRAKKHSAPSPRRTACRAAALTVEPAMPLDTSVSAARGGLA
jgi:hypothetical protein